MDTQKLITVVVWATIVLVVYELFKSLTATAAGASSTQLGGGTLGDLNQGTSDLASAIGALEGAGATGGLNLGSVDTLGFANNPTDDFSF